MDSLPARTEIALSKAKLALLVAGAAGFVVLGMWMWSLDAAAIAAHGRYRDPLLVHGIALMAMLFFGLCGLFGLRKLCDRRPGLVFDAAGITDHSSGVAAGLIPWHDITGFSVLELYKQRMVVVLLRDAQSYLQAAGPLKRLLIMGSYRMCGSPVAISANALRIDFDQLLATCQRYHARYGQSG